MSTTRQYVTNKATETVHLMSTHPVAETTLCGQKVAVATHLFGDETTNGLRTTCATCLERGRFGEGT